MAAPKRKEERAELTARVYELRKAGASMGTIARQLGISSGTVYRYIEAQTKVYLEEAKESHATLMALELSRLDDMQLAVWTKARAGDRASIDIVVRIMQRRAALVGLDIQRPTRSLQLNLTPDEVVKMTDDDLQRFIEQFS